MAEDKLRTIRCYVVGAWACCLIAFILGFLTLLAGSAGYGINANIMEKVFVLRVRSPLFPIPAEF